MATVQDRINGLIGDLGVKPPVLVATTAAITLSGEQTIDGVAVVAEDRVLVKDQTDTTTNGIYYCQASTWVRAPDFDGTRDALQGTLVVVATGTTNAGTLWRLTTADPVIGTSNLTFSLFPISASAFVQTLLDDTTAAAFLASLGFSAFIQTLLGAANAAAARTVLGSVGLTGNETVAGIKTFSTSPVIPTAAAGTNTTDAASTAYVIAQNITVNTPPIATTSGTSVELSAAVPSWAKRVTLLFNSVSTNGTSNLLVQLGSASGYETSGYGSESLAVEVTTPAVSTATSGLIINSNAAGNSVTGRFTLELYSASSFTWVSSHALRGNTTRVMTGSGIKSVAAALSKIRITTVAGTDTFDAGAITLLYE